MAQNASTDARNTPQVILGWVWVGIPLAWGVISTLQNVAKLFK